VLIELCLMPVIQPEQPCINSHGIQAGLTVQRSQNVYSDTTRHRSACSFLAAFPAALLRVSSGAFGGSSHGAQLVSLGLQSETFKSVHCPGSFGSSCVSRFRTTYLTA
jgi:hypothetical protein